MQISSFCVVAAFGGFWWLKWAMLKTELKSSVWRHLGRFSSLVCVGSVCGAIAWGARTRALTDYYSSGGPDISNARSLSLLSSTNVWFAVYNCMYAVEVLCLSVAKLIVLDRLTEHVVRGMQRELSAQGLGKVWYSEQGLMRIGRGLVFTVMLSGGIGLVASIAAAAYKLQTAELCSSAAAACDSAGKHTNTSLAFYAASNRALRISELGNSVQNLSEVVALVVIVCAFLCVGPLCLLILRKAQVFLGHTLRRIDAHSAATSTSASTPDHQRLGSTVVPPGMKGLAHAMVDSAMQAAVAQRRRIIAACLVVELTFLPRAAFDMLQGFSDANDVSSPNCSTCGTCQALSRLVRIWIDFTPEFQFIVIAISSPLPIVVSLWCMMSPNERRLLLHGSLRESEMFTTGVERGSAFARGHMHIDLPLQTAESPLLGRH